AVFAGAKGSLSLLAQASAVKSRIAARAFMVSVGKPQSIPQFDARIQRHDGPAGDAERSRRFGPRSTWHETSPPGRGWPGFDSVNLHADCRLTRLPLETGRWASGVRAMRPMPLVPRRRSTQRSRIR